MAYDNIRKPLFYFVCLTRLTPLCNNIAETFTPQLISVEGGEVYDYVSTYA